MTSQPNAKPPCLVVIIGGGFAGLNAARGLGNVAGVQITVVDRNNHHLFQPLLYQVAMAGLSPANIAAPIRSLLARYRNIDVRQGTVQSIDLSAQRITTDYGTLEFDTLILACGAKHSYFGHDEWEEHAPGLKTLEQATEIRRRVLFAFEEAERCESPSEQSRFLTFVVVGGGPMGFELAGAIGEMSRFTLAKDFRHIDAQQARIVLVEAGPRILAMFPDDLTQHAVRDLASLGVELRLNAAVTKIDSDGVEVGGERIHAATVLWAAGVKASPLGAQMGLATDRQGRVIVEPDLSVPGHANVFVAGDQASWTHQTGKPLPGIAPVALQQGRYLAALIRGELKGKPREPFRFHDKGQMATIGRSRAIIEMGRLRLTGFVAWLVWLVVHIYYLTGFPNRLLVIVQWAWSYLAFKRGARLITNRDWHLSEPTGKPE